MKFKLSQLLQKVAKPITNKIYSFKGCHKGESCYIFGDGISIKWFDLTLFKKKPAFALNHFQFHKQARTLNLKYKVFTAPYWFYPYYQGRRHYLKYKYLDILKNDKKSDYFVSLSNYPILRGLNIFYLFRTINDPKSSFLVECQTKGIDINSGSLISAISLSIYMGFKEIILVGCDYTHDKPKIHHWYEKGEGLFRSKTEGAFLDNFLKIANKYVKITTITLSGGSNIVKGISYKKFTGHTPLFQENYDLTDKETLKILNMYGYNVF